MKITHLLIVFNIVSIPGLVFAGTSGPQVKSVTASAFATIETEAASTVLSTIEDDKDPGGHGKETPSQYQAVSSQLLFSESGRSVAYTVEKGGKVHVVHNSEKGNDYSGVDAIALSFDGRHMAYAASGGGKWFMVIDGREGRAYSRAESPVFSPNGKHLAYQATDDDKSYLVVDNTPIAEAKNGKYTNQEFSSDSSLIAYIENTNDAPTGRLIIQDWKVGKKRIKKSIGNLLLSNQNKTRLAATQIVGKKLRVIDFSFAKPDDVHKGLMFDAIEKLTFGDDGATVSYVASQGGKRLLVLDKREESLPQGDLSELPVVRPDNKGVGILLSTQNGFFLHQAFINGAGQAKHYEEAGFLSYSKDSRHYAHAARKGADWFIVVDGNEGPAFDRVVTPVFSPDGTRLVYRARKDGKRFLIEADTAGKTIKKHPSYEQVFRPVFTDDGKSVAYGVKEGNMLIWKVEGL